MVLGEGVGGVGPLVVVGWGGCADGVGDPCGRVDRDVVGEVLVALFDGVVDRGDRCVGVFVVGEVVSDCVELVEGAGSVIEPL